MAIQFSTTVRNAMLDAVETAIGTAPLLQLWSGAQPANCAAADAGTKLVEMILPSDWMAAASSGSKAKSGSYSAVAVAGSPTVAVHFRIKESTGTTCHWQGSVGIGTGDLQLDNTSIATGQTVSIPTTFTLAAANS
jgi:hypothetical protein